MQGKTNKAIIYWLLTGAVLVLGMVVVGGITRLTGSGLSMVEWNLLSGAIPPLTEAQWQAMFAKYQQFPQFQKVNFSMTLAGFKQIFWWEYLHRLLGRFIGLVFLLPFFYFLLTKQVNKWLLKRLLLLLLLGMAQGLMGWVMVKSGLVDNPHVSHYRLAAHFSLALALIGVILWTVADLVSFPTGGSVSGNKKIHRLSLFGMALLLGQMVLGAFVAGLRAGLYYNTFPLMNGQFFPEVLKEVLTWQNFMENGSLMQFLHRWLAMGVAVYWGWLWWKTQKMQLSGSVQVLLHLVVGTLLVQVGLGIATLLWQVPVTLGVLHQVTAALLFSGTLLLVHQSKSNTMATSEKRIPQAPALQKMSSDWGV